MTSAHVTIAMGNGTAHGKISVLSVHVVGTGSRVVSQPDTKVLDLVWRLLSYLYRREEIIDQKAFSFIFS